MGTEKGGRRAVCLFIGASIALAGLLAMDSQNLRPPFWQEGDSWIRPVRCLACGGQLERPDPLYLACSACGLRVSVPDAESLEQANSALAE
jgi:hypothetical protein